MHQANDALSASGAGASLPGMRLSSIAFPAAGIFSP